MTAGLIDALLAADPGAPLFFRRDRIIPAGAVRAAAARAAERMAERPGDVVLHTASAAAFAAGILAAAALRRRIVLPAQVQPAYLADLGVEPDGVLGDEAFGLDAGADAPVEASALAEADRDPLLVFFTSGSTGRPKQILRPLHGLDEEARRLDALWGREAGRVEATVSHQHIYGLLFRIMWPVLSGRPSSDRAAAYWEELEGRLGPEATLVSSPAHLRRLPPGLTLAAPPPLVISSGQALPWDAAQACARAFGRPPLEVLGSTETGGIAWRRQDEPDAPWTPFEAVRVSADADGALLVASRYFESGEPHRTGDAVELLPDGSGREGRRFRLAARLDRVAKIDGKRISLARVEEKLALLPEIAEAAALALPRRRGALGAVCVLTDAGRAALAAEGAFRLARRLRAAAAGALEPAERPKHWRFPDAVPVNAQGKRVQAALEALFDDPLSVLDLDIRAHTDDRAEIAFRLAPELVFFRGHFPGRPILPGVAQAHIAMLLAGRLWGFRPQKADLARVKFRRVLLPGDEVVLRLGRKGARVRFEYRLGEIAASEGEVGETA